jgi:hypothetical protein
MRKAESWKKTLKGKLIDSVAHQMVNCDTTLPEMQKGHSKKETTKARNDRVKVGKKRERKE